mmetsp:Transcript_46237/g.91196  ORF Transcript_46237/g.91196 Transcript_46237/m.91196 type:complete len:230 (-) Transcript_46237:149-838(-)
MHPCLPIPPRPAPPQSRPAPASPQGTLANREQASERGRRALNGTKTKKRQIVPAGLYAKKLRGKGPPGDSREQQAGEEHQRQILSVLSPLPKCQLRHARLLRALPLPLSLSKVGQRTPGWDQGGVVVCLFSEKKKKGDMRSKDGRMGADGKCIHYLMCAASSLHLAALFFLRFLSLALAQMILLFVQKPLPAAPPSSSAAFESRRLIQTRREEGGVKRGTGGPLRSSWL